MQMDSDQVLALLDRIASTPGRLAKEALVRERLDDPLFRSVLIAAYDPFTTYGVTGIPAATSGTALFTSLPSFMSGLSERRLTGKAAAQALADWSFDKTAGSRELLRRVLTKDLRAGFTAGTINRVEPGMIPVFELMLAHKFEEKRIYRWPVAVEPKLDGVRVACIVKGSDVQFLSRNGKPFPAVEHLKWQMIEFLDVARGGDDVFFDGEIVAGTFNKTVGDVRRKDAQAHDVVYHVFDGMPLNLFTGDQGWSSDLRRDWLEALFSRVMTRIGIGSFPFRLGERVYAHSLEEVMTFYNDYRARGLEGAIVKPPNTLYEKKRSYAWLKIKGEETHDVVVTGAFEGTGKYEGMLGGLRVDFKGVEVRVGGGFSDEQRRDLWHRLMLEKVGKGDVLGSIIEVEAHEVTIDGSLRHPRFVRFRPDLRRDEEAA